MKLTQARVQNFRSIVDSGLVEIEERVTVLVGKNEQGKTTLLKALSTANRGVSYTTSDLPTHLRPELERRDASKLPILSLLFTLDAGDVAALSEKLPTFSSASALKIVKYFDGSYSYSVIKGESNEELIEFERPDLLPFVVMTLPRESGHG